MDSDISSYNGVLDSLFSGPYLRQDTNDSHVLCSHAFDDYENLDMKTARLVVLSPAVHSPCGFPVA